jgi:hypothetical protein
MEHLTENSLRTKVVEYGEAIKQHAAQTRMLQEKMLKEIPLEQWALATAALDAWLERNRGLQMVNNTLKFKDVGIANTGYMSGTNKGINNVTTLNANGQPLLEALNRFKRSIKDDSLLSNDQKDDALTAADALKAEAKKPEKSWNMSKIRNGIAALKMLGSCAHTLIKSYEEIHPLIADHFHLSS